MAQIVLGFEHFSKLTLPTAKSNLASIDLLSGEMNYAIIIERRDYRVDGYSGRRKIYFGIYKYVFANILCYSARLLFIINIINSNNAIIDNIN